MLSKIIETLYYGSPVFLQNFAISLYGAKVNHQRHAGLYSKYYEESVDRLNFNSTALEKYSNNQLKSLLNLAASSVPYYQKLFKENQIKVSDINSVADLSRIPPLEKAVLRTIPEELVSTDYNIRDLICLSTTGSTGTPLKIYCNSNVRRRNYAFYDRFLNTCGVESSDLKATFGGRVIMPSKASKPPFWRFSSVQKNMLFSSYHLSDENMSYFIKKLKALRPDYIDSYPSSIYAIANFSHKNNKNLTGITKAITTSGETLHLDQKQLIEDEFGVPVFDQYGCAEMCVFIAQCNEGRYHIHSDFGVVELLDDNGQLAKPGEEAEIVCTGFINDVMPLIRYRIGDRALVSESVSCKCGSHFPLIKALLGRNDDVIVTPEGNRVGRLSPVLKGFPVKEAQYIQSHVESVKVLLVVSEGYNESSEASLLVELRKRLGEKIEINFEYVKKIERGKGAKFKSIISKLNRY